MDLQEYLRLQDLFPGNNADGNMDPSAVPQQYDGGIPPPMPMTSLDTTPMRDPMAPVDDSDPTSYRPRHTLTDAYQNALMNPPVDQPVSKWRRLAGIASGALMAGTSGDIEGGVKLGRFVSNSPNETRKADYTEKTTQLGKGAAEEDRFNTNERIRANNAGTQEVNRGKLDNEIEKTNILWEKNKNIHDTKMAEIQRKVEESDAKLMMAKRKLDQNQQSIENLNAYHQATVAAMQARHERDGEMMDFKIKETQRMNDARIAALAKRPDASGSKTTTQNLFDADGKPAGRKVTTSGPTLGKVRMLSADGITEVDVPEDKVQDFIDNYGGSRKQ